MYMRELSNNSSTISALNNQRRNEMEVKNSSETCCELCHVEFPFPSKLKRHLLSKKHTRRERALKTSFHPQATCSNLCEAPAYTYAEEMEVESDPPSTQLPTNQEKGPDKESQVLDNGPFEEERCPQGTLYIAEFNTMYIQLWHHLKEWNKNGKHMRSLGSSKKPKVVPTEFKNGNFFSFFFLQEQAKNGRCMRKVVSVHRLITTMKKRNKVLY